MQFCEAKAKLLAEILSNQIDEEGYSSKWIVNFVVNRETSHQTLTGFRITIVDHILRWKLWFHFVFKSVKLVWKRRVLGSTSLTIYYKGNK